MPLKEKFSAADFETLKLSFYWVFRAVAGVDNKIDRKEKNAFQIFIDNGGKFKSELANDILIELKESGTGIEDLVKLSGKDFKSGLQETAKVLAKTDDEISSDFKKLLIAFGAYIGDSSGKFFDFKFSDEEEESLNRIGEYLGTSTQAILHTKIVDRLLAVINEK